MRSTCSQLCGKGRKEKHYYYIRVDSIPFVDEKLQM
jgi:hypothetical protein